MRGNAHLKISQILPKMPPKKAAVSATQFFILCEVFKMLPIRRRRMCRLIIFICFSVITSANEIVLVIFGFLRFCFSSLPNFLFLSINLSNVLIYSRCQSTPFVYWTNIFPIFHFLSTFVYSDFYFFVFVLSNGVGTLKWFPELMWVLFFRQGGLLCRNQ